MVCANLTLILLYVLVGGVLLCSPYRKVVVRLSLLILLYLTLKMLIFKLERNYPQVSKEYLREIIKPGDLIFTFNVKEWSRGSIYNIAHFISNEDLVHSLYVIEYQGKPYVFNTYENYYYYGIRKNKFRNEKSTILLADNGTISGRLEPLEEFLHVESLSTSYIRVVKTKKKVEQFRESDLEYLNQIANMSPIHCCMAVAKYLEYRGIMSNTSAFNDLLYYVPDVLRKKLEPISDIVYQLK